MANKKQRSQAIIASVKKLRLRNEPGEILVVKVDTSLENPERVLEMIQRPIKKVLGEDSRVIVAVIDKGDDIYKIKLGA